MVHFYFLQVHNIVSNELRCQLNLTQTQQPIEDMYKILKHV